ncbi:MAG: zf-HC2 domain-containing protein [Acidobacteriota bacterium]|nr:zf-HC2 domain-containing protein [Acidobacteriota bacterium]
MDESKRPLESELRQALERQARDASTEHPEPEALAAYHHGELDEIQEASMQEHLLWCRHCTGLLLGLQELASGENLEESQSSDRSVPAAPPMAAGSTPTARHPQQPALGKLLPTLLAASLLIAAGLLFQLFRLQGKIDHLSEPRVNVAVQDLYLEDSLRAPIDGTGNTPEDPAPELPADAEWITLILNAPAPGISESTFYDDHQLVIEDDEGKEIWQRRGLTPSPYNTFSVVLHRSFLPPGSYRLRVLGLEQDRWVEIGDFPLRVAEP